MTDVEVGIKKVIVTKTDSITNVSVGTPLGKQKFTPDSDTGGNRSFQISRALEYQITSEMGVMTPNGIADCSTVIRSMMLAASQDVRKSRREVVLRDTRGYRFGISQQLLLYSGVRLILDGQAELLPLVNNIRGVFSNGSIPTYVASADEESDSWYHLTADASRGAVTVTLSSDDVATFSVGDLIAIRSNQRITLTPNSKNLTAFQLARISGKDSTVIHLDRILEYNFNIAEFSKIVKVTNPCVDAEIHNLKWGAFGHTYKGNAGVDIRYGDSNKILAMRALDNRPDDDTDLQGRDAINLSSAPRTYIQWFEGNNLGWYGLNADGASHDVKLVDSYTVRARHHFSGNWNGPGEPLRLKVLRGHAQYSYYAGADMHDVGSVDIEDFVSEYSTRDSGYQARCSNYTLTRCKGNYNYNFGFAGRLSGTSDQTQLVNHRISGNCEFIGNSKTGVYDDGFDLEISNTLIEGNGTDADAIYAGITLHGGKIHDVTIKDNYGAAISYGSQGDSVGTLHIHDVTAPKNTNQIYFMYQPSGFTYTKLSISKGIVAKGYNTDKLFFSTTDNNPVALDITGMQLGDDPLVSAGTLSAGKAFIVNDNVVDLNLVNEDNPKQASIRSAPTIIRKSKSQKNVIRNYLQYGVTNATSNLPTNWFIGGSGLGTLNKTISNITRNTLIPYVDYRIHGTSSTNIFSIIWESKDKITAANSEVWDILVYLALVGGDFTNITEKRLMVQQWNGSSFLSYLRGSNLTLNSTLSEYTYRATLNEASMDRALSGVEFTLTSGTAIDFTLRIGLPRMIKNNTNVDGDLFISDLRDGIGCVVESTSDTDAGDFELYF